MLFDKEFAGRNSSRICVDVRGSVFIPPLLGIVFPERLGASASVVGRYGFVGKLLEPGTFGKIAGLRFASLGRMSVELLRELPAKLLVA
jgi:hypothetical protein